MAKMAYRRKGLGSAQEVHAKEAVESFGWTEHWLDEANKALDQNDCAQAYRHLRSAQGALSAGTAHSEGVSKQAQPRFESLWEALVLRSDAIEKVFTRNCIRQSRGRSLVKRR